VLLVLTKSYPFDGYLEGTFVAPELPYLADAFDRVIVLPGSLFGRRQSAPDGVEVSLELGNHLDRSKRNTTSILAGLEAPWFRSEILARPSLIRSRSALRRLLASAVQARLLMAWLPGFVARIVPSEPVIAYTYWCEALSLGLVEAKAADQRLRVVSRAHGSDLYPERYTPAFLPAQSRIVAGLDHLFPDSATGAEYLRRRFPDVATRITPAFLGVPATGFRTAASAERSVNVVSCSPAVEVKRLDLILAGVSAAAQKHPGTAFTWTHFGEGPWLARVRKLIAGSPPSVDVRLPGYPSHEHLMTFYRTQAVDVFVNASSSEGTPVAAMEAMSCAIPLVATAVGGNPELLANDNGRLVGPDPTPEELGDAIAEVGLAKAANRVMARRSLELWGLRYDAKKNYTAFAGELLRIQRAAH
jgi:glycosyltransferase involved in cell wall biosynthesis